MYKAAKKRQLKKLKEYSTEKLICMEIRKRARKRGIPFDIEPPDIIIPKTCPILGIELSFGNGRVHLEKLISYIKERLPSSKLPE